MTTPYRLWFISETRPETPDEIHSSNQMISWGLLSGLAKLSHISVSHCRTQPRDYDVTGVDWDASINNQEPVDFTLIHSYTPAPIFDKLDIIRAKTSRQVLWMSECPHSLFDHSFTFLPFDGCDQISFPAPLDLLNNSMVGIKKLPGSILLDHAWGWSNDGSKYKDGAEPDPNLWCSRLYEWLYSLKDSVVIGQLERPTHEELANLNVPNWVQKIPGAFYPEYLRMTAPYENFIMTHPGSYEHSIIDMAARGIRVLVPTPTERHSHRDGWAIVMAGNPFAPWDTISRLNLPVFSGRNDLLYHLNRPRTSNDQKDHLCTDLSKVAIRIDTYCQKVLNE